MKTLLVVAHTPTASMRTLVEALVAGARDEEIVGVQVDLRAALEATADDVLAADGYVLATPANFGYMSGALKHFFDSTFLQIGGALDPSTGSGQAGGAGPTARRPYGLLVHGRYDTAGAVRSVQSIVTALDWRQSAEIVEILGDVDDAASAAAYELGGSIAALLME